MDKINIKKNIIQAISAFAISTAVLMVIWASQEVFPFGDNTMIVWDMKIQYSAFMAWYSDVLRGNAPFFIR